MTNTTTRFAAIGPRPDQSLTSAIKGPHAMIPLHGVCVTCMHPMASTAPGTASHTPVNIDQFRAAREVHPSVDHGDLRWAGLSSVRPPLVPERADLYGFRLGQRA